MQEQNNIDKLFQEQLGNLEATPNQRVWGAIEAKLAPKKRRILPFWWFSSGIAALFILGLLLFPSTKNETILLEDKQEIIVDNTNSNTIKSIETIDSILKNTVKKEDILLVEKTKNTNKKEKQFAASKLKKKVKGKFSGQKNAMEKIFLADNSNGKETAFKENESKKDSPYKKKNNLTPKQEKSTKKENKKIPLTNLNSENETINIKKPSPKKWSVAPTFAVLNSNSFSNTSPIDMGLSSSTQGQNSFSYGIQVGYKINNRWAIQSGIHLQEISYTNNQVIVSTNTLANSSAVSFNNSNSENLSIATITEVSSDFVRVPSLNNTVTGSLAQDFGYVEIPLEVKYSLNSKTKLQTQLVGGFSSLFLNKNAVELDSNLLNKSGVATNLNSLNFSGNIGIDFNYNFSKNWSIYINPMFKTYFNTFSENSNDFSPFNIGVYSGINFQF